jgi:O-antigen ligase
VCFVTITLALTWLGNEFSASGAMSPWFQKTSFGVPLNFILFFLILAVLLPYVVNTPQIAMTQRITALGMFWIVALVWTVIGLAIVVAIARGVPELFADWRNLLITAITAIFASKWLAAQRWKKFAVTDLAIAYGLLAIPTLVAYAAGSGVVVLGVRTTVFDGPTLYTAIFSACVAGWYALNPDASHGRGRTTALRLAGSAASLLVLLSFRRSFWLGWLVGLIAVLVVSLRSRRRLGIRVYSALLGFFVLIAVATIAIGTETILARLESFLPSASGQYSVTNEDHVNDLIDAWRVIEREPILGLGIGSRYETNLISDWKTESFEVHNALLHVWLKFGIAGAVAYFVFHLSLVRAALRHSSTIPIAAFFVGELLATMVGTWPYGSFQMSVFHGLLIAIMVANVQLPRLTKPSPPDLQPARPAVGTG